MADISMVISHEESLREYVNLLLYLHIRGGCNCRLSALSWGNLGELPAQVRTGEKPGFHVSLLLVYQAGYWVAQVARLISES